RTFAGSGKSSVLAVKLTGNFKTAFPSGDPEALPPADANGTSAPDKSLKVIRENSQPVVVLVGDVDLLSDGMPANQPLMDIRGNRAGFAQSNITFIMNLADYLTGDDDLIRVRSKSQRDRPLELLDRMIEKKTRDTQVELDKLKDDITEANEQYDKADKEYDESQRKMLMTLQLVGNEISVNKEEHLKAQAAHAELQKKIQKAEEVRKVARAAVRKKSAELREEISALKFRIKWANILIMPALVALFGVLVAVAR
ncbi:uncharacterized protein METZ01_LOCUS453940, partial [marine metagenome]